MSLLLLCRIIVEVAVAGLGTYLVLSVSYCLWLLIAAVISRLFVPRDLVPEAPRTRFCVLIPAHDEEVVIGSTLQSIGSLEYPPELFATYVIADNCCDQTVQIASTYEFVRILSRTNLDQRGKGYALNWALSLLIPDVRWDAFVIIDADTRIDKRFLLEMDAHRCRTLPGRCVAQGRYDVLNANETWRTALLAGALSLVHVLRPTARQFLGLSVGLKGNGMCFDSDILASVPWRGNSLTEDIDFTVDLLEEENLRVSFVPGAKVAALMPSTAKASASQRERWENGRTQTVKSRAVSMLMRGLVGLNAASVDIAVDLLVPPLAELFIGLTVWIGLILLLHVIGGNAGPFVPFAGYCVVGLFAYILVGFGVSGAPRKAFFALLNAPFYAAWKLALRLTRPSGKGDQWVRTQREVAVPVALHSSNGSIHEAREDQH